MKSPFDLATKRAASAPTPQAVLRWFRSRTVAIAAVLLCLAIVIGVAAQSAVAAGGDDKDDAALAAASVQGKIVLSAGIVMAAALLAAGYAVATVGAAALGAASERPELMVRSLVFVALAEGIAVWGLIVVVVLIGKM